MDKYNKKNNRQKAEKHEALIHKLFASQIDNSIKSVQVFNPNFSFKNKAKNRAKQIVWAKGSDQAAIKAFKEFKHQKIAVLDFADYTAIGGGYLHGLMAQEEEICGQSTLYPVLQDNQEYFDWNKEHRNQGLYLDRALYIPDILWAIAPRPLAKTDVIVCAAPRKSRSKYIENPSEKARFFKKANETMLKRMNFVKEIAEKQNVDVLILGAWGAGAFGFDAKEVAEMWQKTFEKPSTIKTVIYAVIPDKRSNNAVQAFKSIFKI